MRVGVFRGVTLLFAVAQLALPAALSVGDGIDANSVGAGVAHVEDIAGKQCKPPHSADCAVCRYLATGSVGNSATATGFAGSTHALVAATSVNAPLSAAHFRLRSRAPPTFLS